MLSKRKLKFFKSLQIKKYRVQSGNFLVEGAKGVEEALKSQMEIDHLVVTQQFHDDLIAQQIKLRGELDIVTENELKAAGTFGSNNAGLVVMQIPSQPTLPKVTKGLTILLDDVRDPGNLGTIIRLADWYGVENVICSNESADLYNPKVINSTMGSFARVQVFYTDLADYLSKHNSPVYGTLLNGNSIYQEHLNKDALILMGNESKGVSERLLPYIDHPIQIPGRGGAESLNVAIATAITLDNFYR
jgi:TrmH family RNA methyltransferase